MEIIRIDVFDDTAFGAWYEANCAAIGFGRVDPPLYSRSESAVAFRQTDGAYGYELYSAVEDGTVVGTIRLELPRHDNLNLADMEVAVVPAHRRRGVGTALYRFAAARAEELGRTSVLGVVHQPNGAEEVPAVAFLTGLGFTRRNVEMRRVLDLPVPPEQLERLAAKAAEKTGGYELKSWPNACPEKYAEQYAHLKSLLMTEAPVGDMEYEAEVWDVARLRAEERKTFDQGRQIVTTVAFAPDGTIAAHTQIGITPVGSTKAFQWDTLVLPEHRGHRLGLALKVANLQETAERFPDRTAIETWNAVQNGPMVAVNLELGFREVERFEEWQRG